MLASNLGCRNGVFRDIEKSDIEVEYRRLRSMH